MPSHEIHEMIDEMVIGEAHDDVHDYLDSTVQVSGSAHRDDPIHTLEAAITYAALNQDPDKLDSAMLHLAADDFFTPEMEEMFKMLQTFNSYGGE